jgi:hypothetical protein
MGYAPRWEQFFNEIEPVATATPFMVVVGNHDIARFGSRGECGVPFNKRFQSPQNGKGNYWYSIDYPLAHIVVISTEHDYSPSSDQYQWLQRELDNVDHTKQWLIVMGHKYKVVICFLPLKANVLDNRVSK